MHHHAWWCKQFVEKFGSKIQDIVFIKEMTFDRLVILRVIEFIYANELFWFM